MLHKLDGWCFTSVLFFLVVADGFHRIKAFGGDVYGYRPLANYRTISIYSTCRNASFQTAANKYAWDMKSVKSILYLWDGEYETNHRDIEDICNNTDTLQMTLVDLLLQEDYFFQPKTNQNTGQQVWRNSNIGDILALVPEAMSIIIQNYFSFTNVFKVCSPLSCDERLTVKSLDDQL